MQPRGLKNEIQKVKTAGGYMLKLRDLNGITDAERMEYIALLIPFWTWRFCIM